MARYVYTVRLRVRTDQPLSAERIAAVQGGTWGVEAVGHLRGRTLDVAMTMESGDPAGAILRAQNVILDHVPGRVVHTELDEAGPRMPKRRMR